MGGWLRPIDKPRYAPLSRLLQLWNSGFCQQAIYEFSKTKPRDSCQMHGLFRSRTGTENYFLMVSLDMANAVQNIYMFALGSLVFDFSPHHFGNETDIFYEGSESFLRICLLQLGRMHVNTKIRLCTVVAESGELGVVTDVCVAHSSRR